MPSHKIQYTSKNQPTTAHRFYIVNTKQRKQKNK